MHCGENNTSAQNIEKFFHILTPNNVTKFWQLKKHRKLIKLEMVGTHQFKPRTNWLHPGTKWFQPKVDSA